MPLSARVSPAAQKVIHEAFKDLQRTISDKDQKDFSSTTLDNVIEAAHQIEDQLAARQSLRNMRRLVPLFDGLQYYSRSIEVVCNGTPYLPWIWAPIKLILKVASDYVEAFEKLIVAYARIAEPLTRFKILHQTFSKNMEVQQTLATFYSDILKFHKEAYKFVRRGSWRTLFMTSWGRFQRRFDNIIDDLKAHENLVDRTANAVGLSEARKMREELDSWRQESLQKLAQEESESTTSQYIAIVGWLKLDDSEQGKIFDAITAESLKYPETCGWVFRQEKIAAWLRCSQESTFLVLRGHPGTGKSVLATRMAAFLRSSDKPSLVVTHFCTYSQLASTEYDQILRSILLQLVRNDTDLVAYIYQEFLLKKKSVTTQAIERLILDVIGAISDDPSQTKYVHIILDGLDECDKEKQLKVVTLLERLVSTALGSTSTVCKVLLSSHMGPSVDKKLKQKNMVSLSNEKSAIGNAISTYAAHRLGALRPRWFQMGIKDTEVKDLEQQLVRKADGMFLWARLVLDYLTNNLFRKKSEVMEAVDRLPRKLGEFYEQILRQLISNFDQRSVTYLKSIFGWIAFAKRPLRKAELRAALSFSFETGEVDIAELAPKYLFDMCGPLIEQRSDSTLAFIHVSVKEFLQSPESNLILDEATIAEQHGLASATCLLSGLRVFQPAYSAHDRCLRVLRGFHSLHVYASEYWMEYLLSVTASETGLNSASLFFWRSHELSATLNSIQLQDGVGVARRAPDARIDALQKYPQLWNAATNITAMRGPTDFEAGRKTDGIVEITNLSTMLLNYQHTVNVLLNLSCFDAISIEELESFRQDFRTTAFTCRFPSCPHAVTGFEIESVRDDHERAHYLRIPCEISGCRYPPFSSAQALRSHQARQHALLIPKLRIRPSRDPTQTTSNLVKRPNQPIRTRIWNESSTLLPHDPSLKTTTETASQVSQPVISRTQHLVDASSDEDSEGSKTESHVGLLGSRGDWFISVQHHGTDVSARSSTFLPTGTRRVAPSPNSKYIIAADLNYCDIYHAETGALYKRFTHHESSLRNWWVSCVCLTRDMTHLFNGLTTNAKETIIEVWVFQTGETYVLPIIRRNITSLVAIGQNAVFGTCDSGDVVVWNLGVDGRYSSGQELCSPRGTRFTLISSLASPSGLNVLAYGRTTGEIGIWIGDQHGQALRECDEPLRVCEDAIISIAFTSDKHRFFCATRKSILGMKWTYHDGIASTSCIPWTYPTLSVMIYCGIWIVIGCTDGAVHICHTVNGKTHVVLKAHDEKIQAITASHGCFTTASNNKIRVWWLDLKDSNPPSDEDLGQKYFSDYVKTS